MGDRICLLLMILLPLHGANREVDALLDRARAVPPEFAADALLQIAADAKLLPSKTERIDIVEEAFRLAAHAQMPSPLRGRGYHTDTRPGWRDFAGDTGLNSLDLQTRAMESMRALDPARLRDMFSAMRPIDVQPGSCKDPQRPNLTKYYATLLAVAEHGFTPKERADGEPERWVTQHLSAITSPVQLSGAMSAIKKPSEAMLNAFAAALPNIRHDWLGFVYADGDLPYSPQTARALRDYIVRSLRGPRCTGKQFLRTVADVPAPVSGFNTYIVKAHPELQMEPIDPTELEPSRLEEGYVLEEFWKSANSRQVLEELRWLNHGNRNLPDDKRFWTLEERQTTAWNERYLGLLKLMDGWNADDEPTPVDYFHMRAHTYMMLTRLTPPGTQRTNAFRNLITWLNGAYNDPVPHAEWFTHVRHLLRDNKEERWLFDEIEVHGNAVLSLYAHLHKRGFGPVR